MSTPKTLRIPAGVDVGTVSSVRGDFAVHDARPSGESSGHVLLVPGFTGSKEDLTPILPLLARAGWHATAYDQRGQYESAGADSDDYSLDGLAADAIALREAVAGPGTASHLLGHSFGGVLAQTAVLTAPQAWRSLILLCSGPGAFAVGAELKALPMFINAVDSVGLAGVHDFQQSHRPRVAPDIAVFLRARFLANAPAGLKSLARHLLDAPDRIDDIAALGVPAFVVRGQDDNAWPHEVQDAMAVRLDTEVLVVEGSAHSPAVENPAGTVRTLLPLLRR